MAVPRYGGRPATARWCEASRRAASHQTIPSIRPLRRADVRTYCLFTCTPLSSRAESAKVQTMAREKDGQAMSTRNLLIDLKTQIESFRGKSKDDVWDCLQGWKNRAKQVIGSIFEGQEVVRTFTKEINGLFNPMAPIFIDGEEVPLCITKADREAQVQEEISQAIGIISKCLECFDALSRKFQC